MNKKLMKTIKRVKKVNLDLPDEVMELLQRAKVKHAIVDAQAIEFMTENYFSPEGIKTSKIAYGDYP